MSRPSAQTPEAIEAHDVGERPDLGRTPDALVEALSGSGMGSDTRAGSLQGGSASGSDADPDQAEVDRRLAEDGRAQADPQSPPATGTGSIANTGPAPGEVDDGPTGSPGDEAETSTG